MSTWNTTWKLCIQTNLQLLGDFENLISLQYYVNC